MRFHPTSKRHGDAPAARRLHHRDPRDVRFAARSCRRQRRHDLGDRRRPDPLRLRTWLYGYLRAGRTEEPALEHGEGPPLPFGIAVGVLIVAGIGAAFTSDWFVDAIDPAVEELGISKAFTGLVIVAIAGTRSRTSSGSSWRSRARQTSRSP